MHIPSRRDSEIEGTLSLGQGIANHLVQVIGLASVLAVPYSIACGGLVLGVASWCVAGLVMSFTAKLLLSSFYTAKEESGYLPATIPELVHSAFQSRLLTSYVTLTFLLELFGNNISSFLIVSSTLSQFFPNVNSRWFHLLLGIGGWLLNASLSLKHLSWTSAIGSFACVSAALLIFFNGLITATAPGSLWEPAQIDLFPRDKEQWIRATLLPGISIGAVAAHSGLSPIFWSLKNRRRTFGIMLNTTFSLGIATYLISGICGYIMYGRLVDPVVTKDLPHSALNDFMAWFVLVVPFSQYPLFLEPVAQAVEAPWTNQEDELLDDPISEETPIVSQSRQSNQSSQSKRANSFVSQALRLFISLLCMSIALMTTNLATILSLVGAVAATTDCIIVPCMVYLHYEKQGGPQRWFAWMALFLGVCMSVIGTVGTVVVLFKPSL